MQALRFWLPAATCLVACSAPPARVVTEAAPPAAPVATTPPTPPSVSACRARPSTVYGDEPVTFEIEGAAASPVAVEVRDLEGRTVASGAVALPGAWQAEGLASGDFSLSIAASAVTCHVTVNRELSRASSSPR